jgi:pimeloyl-ACP methyl ester carboxylesterase
MLRTKSIHYTETSFGRIAYREAGEGPTALFVHGVLMNGTLWDGVVAEVARDRRCVAPDLLGHGDTEAADPGQDLSFGPQAAMLIELVEALACGPVDLVGNDSGGAICQIFAARRPDLVRSLALTNCDTADNVFPDALVPFMEACRRGEALGLFEQMAADLNVARAVLGSSLAHPERVSDEMLRGFVEPVLRHERDERAIERWMAELTDSDLRAVQADLGGLDVPTLILWGTEDIFFPVDDARRLAALIPRAELVEAPGSKLFHPLDEPELLAGHLRRLWLTASGGSPGRDGDRRRSPRAS